VIYILNFNRHCDSVSELTTQFFRTQFYATEEARRLMETGDMATVQILELDTTTLQGT